VTVFENGELIGEGTALLALLLVVAWFATGPWREPESLARDPEQFYAVARQRGRKIRSILLAIAALWLLTCAVDAWATLH
jgi:hypothetical protein